MDMQNGTRGRRDPLQELPREGRGLLLSDRAGKR